MLHRRYVVERLTIGDLDVPLRHADVVVAARAESGRLDWEVVAHTVVPTEVARQLHDLTLSCVVGADESDGRLELATFRGPAFLVRAVERALVFRGDGPLQGVDLTGLSG